MKQKSTPVRQAAALRGSEKFFCITQKSLRAEEIAEAPIYTASYCPALKWRRRNALQN